MAPGKLTLKGFLGVDTRTLGDIIRADTLVLRNHQVNGTAIADALSAITEKARDIMEQEKEIDGRFRVSVRDDRGLQPSPWGDGRFGKGDTVLFDTKTDVTLRWNELTLHLIRRHDFFGGVGSDYRLDPQTIIGLLPL